MRARHMVPSSNWALAAPLDAGGLASSYARSGRPGYEPCLIAAGGDARLGRVAAPRQYHSVPSTIRYGATAHRWMRPRSHVAYFNVWGTVLAILLLSVGFSGLSLLGVPFWAEPVFDGAALIIGVLLSRSETRAVISGR